MSIQNYRLFLLHKDGSVGCGVVDYQASCSAELPAIILWNDRYFVRVGSYGYSYHERECTVAKEGAVTRVYWRPAKAFEVAKAEQEAV